MEKLPVTHSAAAYCRLGGGDVGCFLFVAAVFFFLDNHHLTASSVFAPMLPRRTFSKGTLISNLRFVALGSLVVSLVPSIAPAATHFVNANNTTPLAPYTTWSSAATIIQDAVDAANPGDLILVTNGTYSSGGRALYGNMTNRVVVSKPVTLQSVNGSQWTSIQGRQISGTTNGNGAIRCVYLADGALLSGFTLTNGGTLTSGDSRREKSGGGVWCESTNARVLDCVLVRNAACYNGGGAYQGSFSNCLFKGNSMPQGGGQGAGAYDAILDNCELAGNSASGVGGGACYGTLNHCALTGNSAYSGGGTSWADLNDCALTNNRADPAYGTGGGSQYGILRNCSFSKNLANQGGGTYWATLSNCIVVSNLAAVGGGDHSSIVVDSVFVGNSANAGGAAAGRSLTNCILLGNTASLTDGGALSVCMADNCLIAGNSAAHGGGGAEDCHLHGCTIVNNSAGALGGGVWNCWLTNCIVYLNNAPSGSNYYDTFFGYCCTAPSVPGPGNVSLPPLFSDYAAGDFRLQDESPCINAGINNDVRVLCDLDGAPRVSGGSVDIGAYEFQTPGSKISFAWLKQYGFPTDGSADSQDPDADGMTNFEEWRCQTDPTAARSVLRILSVASDQTGLTISWPSVEGVNYVLERKPNLNSPFTRLQSDIPGQSSTTSWTDTSGAATALQFYRVGVAY